MELIIIEKNEIMATIKATLLFKERFPNQNIQFEVQCGYFIQWIDRFMKGDEHAYSCMDFASRKAWDIKIRPYLYGGQVGKVSIIEKVES